MHEIHFACNKPSYPREWLERVPAVIFASLVRGEFRLPLHLGSGLANGGVEYEVPTQKIPMDLRAGPNKPSQSSTLCFS